MMPPICRTLPLFTDLHITSSPSFSEYPVTVVTGALWKSGYFSGMSSQRHDLLRRSRAFALTIVRLYCALPNRTEIQVIGKQFLRSGTSVGAHLHEAHRSRSDAEMISKIEVGMQELEESRYWILLLTEASFVDLAKVEPILNEIRELMAILVASVRSLKQRSPASRAR